MECIACEKSLSFIKTDSKTWKKENIDMELQKLFDDYLDTLQFIRNNELPTGIKRKLLKQATKDRRWLIQVGFNPFHENITAKQTKVPPLKYLAAKETAETYKMNLHEIHSSLPTWLEDIVAFEAQKISPMGRLPVISRTFLTPSRFKDIF